MALKDNWINKVDEVDDVLAEDINNIASAVIDLESKEIKIGYEDEIDTYIGESVKTYLIVDYTRDIPEEEQGQFDQYYLIFIPRRYNFFGSLADVQYKIDSYAMSVRKASYLSSGGYSWSEWQNFEMTTNKVAVIDKNSTNEQYPSAKAVWDALKNTGENTEFEKEIEIVTISNVSADGDAISSLTYEQMNEAHKKGKIIIVFLISVGTSCMGILPPNPDGESVSSSVKIFDGVHWYDVMFNGSSGNKCFVGSNRTTLVYDGLDSNVIGMALSANQGRVLNEKVGDIETALDNIIAIQNKLMGVSE